MPDDETDSEAAEEARRVADALDEIGTDRLADALTDVFREAADRVDEQPSDEPESGGDAGG